MKTKWPKVRLGDVMSLIKREERINPSSQYRLLGAHWYGGGLYIKGEGWGHQIRADRLYRVQTGDFVYNRLFAWKGSFAVVDPDLNDCYVSYKIHLVVFQTRKYLG
jgi:type I restriction enzyme S subunit